MNMVDPIEMKPKRLFIGHPKLSKKSKNTLIGLKLREICIVQVGQFFKKCMKQILTIHGFFPNGPIFSNLKLIPNMVLDL